MLSKHIPYPLIVVVLYLMISPAKSDVLPGDPYAGQKIFQEKGCIQCHQIQGKGGKVGPDLSEQKELTFLGLAAAMWNHSPKMLEKCKEMGIPYSTLSKEEVSHLIAYLSFLRYFGKQGNVFIGKKLLRSKKCLKCHSVEGKGGNIAPDFTKIDFYISPLYIAQAMWNHGPSILKAEKELGIKHIKLKGNEIVDITTALKEMTKPRISKTEYMTFGNIEKGKELYYKKGCASCHENKGSGETVAPDLTKVKFENGVLDIAEGMWNHGPVMWQKMEELKKERPVFEGSEMADLVSYIFYIQYQASTGDATKGQVVFEKKSCVACHTTEKNMAQAQKLVALSPLTSPLSMVQAMWNHIPNMQDKMKEKNIKWPKLTEKDMMNLYAYLKANLK